MTPSVAPEDDGTVVAALPSTTTPPSTTRPPMSLQEALTTAISTGRGVAGIASVLHDVLGRTVVIDDSLGTRLATAGGGAPGGTTLPTGHPDGSRRHAVAFRVDDWLMAEACPDGDLVGVIGLHDPSSEATGTEESVLEQGAMVLAAELFRLHSVASNELRVWGDLAAELLDSPDIDRTRAHAARLGYLIDRPHRALMIEMAGSGSLPPLAAMRRAFRSAGIDDTLVTTRSAGFVVFVAEDSDWDALGRQLNGPDQPRARVGVGDLHGAQFLGESVAEARLALRLSDGPVARYEDLGISRFLAADTDETRVRRFVDTWLGEIESYDVEHAAELVHTLGEWLRDPRSLRATADRLHIHPNTLKYRLHRITELTGRDIHDPEERFNLELACRTRSALLASEASGLHEATRECASGVAPASTSGPPPARPGVAARPVEVAILDSDGVVTWVNAAWEEFCRANGGSLARCGVGTSYFDACEGAPDDPQSHLAVSAVRMAIKGELPAPAWLTMACDSPDQSRWFEMSIAPRRDDEGRSRGATITLTRSTH